MADVNDAYERVLKSDVRYRFVIDLSTLGAAKDAKPAKAAEPTPIGGAGNTNWVGVAVFTAGLCLINIIAVATGRETYRVATEQLGQVPAAGSTAR